MQKIKKWFADYWYYYKWYVIGTAFVAVVLIICLVQCAGGADYNVFITYAGSEYVGVSESGDGLTFVNVRSSIKNSLSDGVSAQVKEISVKDLIYVNSALAEQYTHDEVFYDAQANANSKKTLNSEVVAGDSYIYIIDKELYESLRSTGVFAPLKSVFGEDVPGSAYDEYGIEFNKTEFCKYYSSVYMNFDDMILCLRAYSDSALNFLKGSEKTKASYELHKSVFVDMVRYTAPK